MKVRPRLTGLASRGDHAWRCNIWNQVSSSMRSCGSSTSVIKGDQPHPPSMEGVAHVGMGPLSIPVCFTGYTVTSAGHNGLSAHLSPKPNLESREPVG